MSNQPIRILIINDNELDRVGLKLTLESDAGFEVVDAVASTIDLVRCCNKLRPHVVLLDPTSPKENSVTVTHTIHQYDPAIQVVALASQPNHRELVEAMLRAGAISYLYRHTPVAELIKAIHKAHIGIPTLMGEATSALVSAVTSTSPTGKIQLSAQERNVLACVADSLTNKQIADRLMLSPHTVKRHMSTIFKKLRVSNRMEAVETARRLNLLNLIL